ncbi:hypothetical protein G3N94_24630 [Burkholderia sp. Ac-20353]|nr:hypothetical protein [Burkholderia sp. Ac-20353]
MDKTSVQRQSLSHHLALAACRDGHGNAYLFNELIRTTYIAWFLQQAGYGDEPVERYKAVEHAVEATHLRADESNEWILAEDAVSAFEQLLVLHDWQLNVAPRYKVIDAEQQLKRFLAGTASSPIPEPCQGGTVATRLSNT